MKTEIGKLSSTPSPLRGTRPCLRGRVSYKRKTNLINGKLRPIRSSVGTRHAVSEKRAKLTQAMSETGIKRTRHAVSLHSQTKGRPSSPPVRGRLPGAVGNEWKQKSITTSRFLPYEESANEIYTAPQIKTLFCPRYSHTLVYSIVTPLYIVLSRPCPREDSFELSLKR